MNKHRPTLVAAMLLLVAVILPAAAHAQDDLHIEPPDWAQGRTLYQVNTRQFSPEGNFEGLRKQLPRLKQMGVGILWLMPIHPIGHEKRSGELGSPYAVLDYKGINPEFGDLDDFKRLVDEAHDLGLRVIIDWVANHTAPDHPWVTEHPDWYTRNEQGEMIPPIPLWADVLDLDFDARDMREAMLDAMAYWVRETDIDGFRCDTAEWLPLDFWITARDRLQPIKPLFILAEGNDHNLVTYAFDALYAWELAPTLERIHHRENSVKDLVNYLRKDARRVTADGFRLNFTTNHDTNAWEGTTAERMGDGLEAFTVATFTIPGMPMIYNGQEAGMNKRLDFFHRDPIDWQPHPMADLYRQLTRLKRTSPALRHGSDRATIHILEEATTTSVLTYERRGDTQTLRVTLNLSDRPQTVRPPATAPTQDTILSKGCTASPDGTLRLRPWAYRLTTFPTLLP
ncbi:alpha-amylase family glycosyl hydrolase [Mucisphaera calidilacus]|uniref:Cyclomaltodextrinase n=1 Tax=Mucisphaera calidilacus TaxID=2527982 RepID=A0A518BUD2_9BACT|nr:alpha-amylase family glycosyl hydrolase [Mucisphaera calidilacus]QDU70590.1 Cyclomaltodextrinase [Mucisphaera calidilacus]